MTSFISKQNFRFYSKNGHEGFILDLNFPVKLYKLPESYLKTTFIKYFQTLQQNLTFKYLGFTGRPFKFIGLNENENINENRDENVDRPFIYYSNNKLEGYYRPFIIISFLIVRFECEIVVGIKQFLDNDDLIANVDSEFFPCAARRDEIFDILKECRKALASILYNFKVNTLKFEQLSRGLLDRNFVDNKKQSFPSTVLPLLGSFLGPLEYELGKEAAYNKKSTRFLNRFNEKATDVGRFYEDEFVLPFAAMNLSEPKKNLKNNEIEMSEYVSRKRKGDFDDEDFDEEQVRKKLNFVGQLGGQMEGGQIKRKISKRVRSKKRVLKTKISKKMSSKTSKSSKI